jgi:hypothetical protein
MYDDGASHFQVGAEPHRVGVQREHPAMSQKLISLNTETAINHFREEKC